MWNWLSEITRTVKANFVDQNMLHVKTLISTAVVILCYHCIDKEKLQRMEPDNVAKLLQLVTLRPVLAEKTCEDYDTFCSFISEKLRYVWLLHLFIHTPFTFISCLQDSVVQCSPYLVPRTNEGQRTRSCWMVTRSSFTPLHRQPYSTIWETEPQAVYEAGLYLLWNQKRNLYWLTVGVNTRVSSSI